MTLGEKLRQLREAKNLMQRQIGALIEVDGAFISKIENNDKPINRQHLKKLSNYFNVKLEELETLWLADKIDNIIEDEETAELAIKEVQYRLKKRRK